MEEIQPTAMMEIPLKTYKKLKELGMLDDEIHSYNVGNSNYSQHFIQPWHIWLEYQLNAFDADIIKRVLRTKVGESRISDYEKIIQVCKERVRQLNSDKKL